jgi:hypothetical protein
MSRTPVTFTKKNYLINFKKRNPETPITPELHFEILKAAGGAMADLLLKEGSLKMGSRIGELMIRKFIPRGKGSNFAVFTKPFESAQQKKPVYEFNDHTGGYIYRFLWNKRKCKGITDKNMWVFKPLRPLKRQLAFLLKNNLADFPIGVDHQEI